MEKELEHERKEKEYYREIVVFRSGAVKTVETSDSAIKAAVESLHKVKGYKSWSEKRSELEQRYRAHAKVDKSEPQEVES